MKGEVIERFTTMKLSRDAIIAIKRITKDSISLIPLPSPRIRGIWHSNVLNLRSIEDSGYVLMGC